MNQLDDSFGRTHNYLRVSVTDRCDLRCVYCMPPEGLDLSSKKEILSYEELYKVVETGVNLGIEKVRLTGGEPFVRRNLVDFIEMLSGLEDLKKLAITTNGLQLKDKLRRLASTQLEDINISLDSLDPDRYERVTRGGDLNRVLGAIDRALDLDFRLKINVVALQDLELDEIDSFVDFARSRNLEVRFIEFMPLCGGGWNTRDFRSLSRLKDTLVNQYNLNPAGDKGVSQVYDLPGGRGQLGFIASLTNSFCESCSRLRLSSTGELYPCLFSQDKISCRETLRNNKTKEKIADKFEEAVSLKWKGNPAYTDDWNPETEAPPESFGLIREVGG
jgi:molybdenum cofactor biosynthesis protein A